MAPVDLYAFRYDGDTILVRSASEQLAICRAFHEVAESYDITADRLERIEWPTAGDYLVVGDLEEPVILDGGE